MVDSREVSQMRGNVAQHWLRLPMKSEPTHLQDQMLPLPLQKRVCQYAERRVR